MVGRENKLDKLKREKKLRRLKEFEATVGTGAATMALLVSMGTNLMSSGLIGRRKLLIWAHAVVVRPNKRTPAKISLRKLRLRSPVREASDISAPIEREGRIASAPGASIGISGSDVGFADSARSEKRRRSGDPSWAQGIT